MAKNRHVACFPHLGQRVVVWTVIEVFAHGLGAEANTSAVISAVLQPLQAINEDRQDLPNAAWKIVVDVTKNSTHS